MSSPFGSTRTRVQPDHALIAADGHVRSPLMHWSNAEGVVLISPAMQPAPRGPRFLQYLVHGGPGCQTTAAPVGVQRLIYLLSGAAKLDGKTLAPDDFAWIPPDQGHELSVDADSTLLVFEKRYEPRGPAVPKRVVGSLSKVEAQPFLGDSDAMLATLLPVEPAFDMAVNVFTYQPGATLPFVETHVMEHGLYMRSGQGVYRLGESWYPVTAGDAIWMAAYCPQWFVAMGKAPASYIYYKDIHRDPLTVASA